MVGPAGRPVGRLARLGFANLARVSALLAQEPLQLWDIAEDHAIDAEAGVIVSDIAKTADPDQAVAALAQCAEAAADPADFLRRLREAPEFRLRLLKLLGASLALADHLLSYPDDWQVIADGDNISLAQSDIRAHMLAVLEGRRTELVTDDRQNIEKFRRIYRQYLLVIASKDLAGQISLEEAVAQLSDLAAATLATAHDLALKSLPSEATPCRLAIIGMGKCGGRELNYVSDVDVIFVADPALNNSESTVDTEQQALNTATALATEIMRICEQVAWPVDAALRPEGKLGPLVRTLASHEAYYRRWARTWEFQALIKARFLAGDQELGKKYLERIMPLVWTAAEREHFVDDVQTMRRRVEHTLPADIAQREVKLGPGGLRDVEFAVQLLQLVHGRADENLRSGNTLTALQALSAGGYVGRTDAAELVDSYRFLRVAEHRLQLYRLRRTHLIPDEPAKVQQLARAIGFHTDERSTAVEQFTAQWTEHSREVRRLHEKLFYRPLLNAVARVPTEGLRLDPAAALVRLQALGFLNPEGALQHIAALTEGISRRAAIQRTLLPVMLELLADAPDPDAGLLAYRKVSESLQDTPWYLRFLRDEGQVAERLATVLGSSRYVADLLARAPEGLRVLADDAELVPRSADTLQAAFRAVVARNEDIDAAVAAVRALRRHELLRVACIDLLGRADVVHIGQALTDIAEATLQSTLDAVIREWSVKQGDFPTAFTIIAMGRLGGSELSYGSDVDVMFVHDPNPGVDEEAAIRAALAVAERLTALLAIPGQDPPVIVDTNLRPEGRNGPLVRSLASYSSYYQRWSSIWEAQALLRARPIAGNAELGARFVELIDPLRYPPEGLAPDGITEIRRIKARVDAERLPRGADPATHTKLGRGALADIEWTVQLLALRFGGDDPAIRSTNTLQALKAMQKSGLISKENAAALEAAWRMATQARNAIMLVRGRASDQLPRHGRDLISVARVCGYRPGQDPGIFLDSYRRATRRARTSVERVFYE